MLVFPPRYDFDPTAFTFTFYSLEPSLSKRVDLRLATSLDAIPAGSPARAEFSATLRADLSSALSAALAGCSFSTCDVGAERLSAG